MRPEFISFDCMGTLFGFWPSYAEMFAAVCRRHGVPIRPEEVEQAQRQGGCRMIDIVREAAGKPPTFTDEESKDLWGRLHGRLLDRLGIRRTDLAGALHRAVCGPDAYRLFDDVIPVLSLLRLHGCRLGVISNFESSLIDILAQFGVRDMVQVTVVSAIDGVSKPAPEAFAIAAVRAGCAAAHCLHVGDNLEDDFHAALGAGWQAVMLDRGGRHAGAVSPRIASLWELTRLVELHPEGGSANGVVASGRRPA